MIVRRLGKLWERMRNTVRNEPRELEIQTEMEEHVRLLAEQYRRRGMTAEAAMLAARRQFGNTTLLHEDLRALQTIPAIEALRGDLRYAARLLRRNPGFAATAVMTLALGIGANTAIFSVCNAVLFKPLPYAEPDRIVMLWERQRDGTLGDVAPANFLDWRDASRSFSGIGIYGVMNYLVIQRTREFGIRLSLGATPTDVLRLVLRRAALLIGAGTCLGLTGSVLLVRFIAKLLFGTAPLDPLTFAAVPILLAAVALVASYIPARRATRIDPTVALRYE